MKKLYNCVRIGLPNLTANEPIEKNENFEVD